MIIVQVGVSTYGGGLWRTWFDRDLSLAGQVVFKRQNEDKIWHKLVDLKRPILNIPNLAIHLETDPASKFEYNKETHLTPVMASESIENKKKKQCSREGEQKSEQDCAGGDNDKDKTDEEDVVQNCCIGKEHHEEMLKLVAQEAGCQVEELLDLDL
jgi:aspartyl aminopeptidase